jgi:hypothetical protein
VPINVKSVFGLCPPDDVGVWNEVTYNFSFRQFSVKSIGNITSIAVRAIMQTACDRVPTPQGPFDVVGFLPVEFCF